MTVRTRSVRGIELPIERRDMTEIELMEMVKRGRSRELSLRKQLTAAQLNAVDFPATFHALQTNVDSYRRELDRRRLTAEQRRSDRRTALRELTALGAEQALSARSPEEQLAGMDAVRRQLHAEREDERTRLNAAGISSDIS